MTIDNPRPYYKVTVHAGSLSWTVERDPNTDPPEPDFGLADPLRVGWSLPNSDLTYVQPDPITGAFSVIVETLADLAGLTIGDPVAVFVDAWPDTDPDHDVFDRIVAVHGRVSAMDSQPRNLTFGQGADRVVVPASLVTINWVDYTVDLAEAPEVGGSVAWPAEPYDVRMLRIRDELGLPIGSLEGGLIGTADLIGAGLDPTLTTLAARPAAPVEARKYIVETFDRMAVANPKPNEDAIARSFLGVGFAGEAAYDLVPDPAHPLVSQSIGNRQFAFSAEGDLPAVLRLVAGKVTMVIDDTHLDTAKARVIDANHVEFSARYSLDKDNRVDTYVITGPYTDGSTSRVVAEPGALPITASVDTELTNPATAVAVGEFNRVGRDSDAWKAEAFTFRADLDPRRLIEPTRLLCDDSYAVAAAQFGAVVINGVNPAQNPSGDTWYAGQVSGVEFSLSGGRYRAVLSIRRNLPQVIPGSDPAPGQALTWDDLAAAWPTKTWNDLEDQHTWFDARLLRSDY